MSTSRSHMDIFAETIEKEILSATTRKQRTSRENYGKRRPLADIREALFSSTPWIGECELDPLLRRVDEISNAIKAGTADPETLNRTLREAVLFAMNQLMAQKELCTLALTDDLTGLYNRRGFLAAAAHQLKLAYRQSTDSLLFFADVDNLKEINDSYGHREGDLALTRIADALEQTFRDSDIVARLGGDEFVALAPNATPYDREIILRRLEMYVEKSNSDDSRYELSLSVGVARFDSLHPVSLGDLITQADEAMFKRKSRPVLVRRTDR